MDYIKGKGITNFDLGCTMASIERTSSGYFKVTIKWHDTAPVTTMHSTEVEALREILSYAEVSDDYQH